MKNEFIPYARQSISRADCNQMNRSLTSEFITRGPCVEKFEGEVARYCGSKFAVAFNSGSTALIAAFHAAKVNQFDRLISTPNTFIATIGSGIQCGASVTLVDIDPITANIDIEQVEQALSKRYSRGRPIVVPVHFAGVAVDIEAMDNLLKVPDALIIEDGCHALGSRYPNGRRVGCCDFSQMTVFSFHPAKTITTGEGGMVTTNDEELFHNLKLFRNNGIERSPPYLQEEPKPWYYEVHELTSNYNFTEFQAALGLSQLARIEEFIEKRRRLVAVYRKLLNGVPNISFLPEEYDSSTAFHLFVAKIDFEAYKTSRESVMEALYDEGIGTQVHYIPLYRHPCMIKILGDISSQFPEMERYYATALSLPLYFDLTFEDVERVVASLLKILNSGKSNNRSSRK
ncbi:MAG: DegT/DnrJ/EryC1/StrS family aminotransferase [Parachlamydiaceae bacterium]|nr:DegT/DnrJ/EryC1/StrS family aminotransferase [Parachlamydiaceae bacterium]